MTNIINFGTLRRTHTGRQTLYRAGFQPLGRIPATALLYRDVRMPREGRSPKRPALRYRPMSYRSLRPRHSHILVPHKWQLLNDRRFDVKAGKLLTVERCRRGGETRTRLT